MAHQNQSDIRQVWGEFTQFNCGCAVDREGEKMAVCPEHSGLQNAVTGEHRQGDWIQTYLGVQFWPLDPRVDEIRLLDIAHALSNVCRFAGHCKQFYSVAQHSVLVSQIVPPDDAKWALLHDAAEAYVGDMPRPIKHGSTYGAAFQAVEHRIMQIICDKFTLPHQAPVSVKVADDAMLMAEKRDLMSQSPARWREEDQVKTGSLLLPEIQPWSPASAEHNFLKRAMELGI